MSLSIAPEDPRAADVQALLQTHLAFAREVTPPGHVHAMDAEALLDPTITFYSARRSGSLLGVGALRALGDAHGEIKSMHTARTARGQGVGRAIVRHLLSVSTQRGYRRVSLETGTGDAFEPARALYSQMGFRECEPFADYTRNPFSVCMTIFLPTSPT